MVDSEQRPGRRALELARALVVTFGGQVALTAAAGVAATTVGRGLITRRRPRQAAVAVLAGAVLYEGALAPRMRHWGSLPGERRRSLPGDDLVADPAIQIDHAVTIDAPAERVWPWVAQIGQDRGGFYSYEWLENLAGCRMRNADRVHAEWQGREIGEPVMLHPLAPGLPVTIFDPPHALGLAGWGVFVVEPIGPRHSRLIVRGRVPRGRSALLYRATLEVPHFIMERRMLLGIKRRAESAAAAPTP